MRDEAGLPSVRSASVEELTTALAAGRLTSVALTQACLDTVSRFDGYFAAVRLVAPDALEAAAASDERRRQGRVRGPLDGVPVLVKDNIDVAGLPTTAGALALEHSVPERDAHLVTRLRATGVVLLGKANLSELANFLTDGMPSGYSSLGGQVLNPYDVALTPSGSSSGSATAVALGMVPLAVGTETNGSILSPAEHQSLVGVKPTVGLVSRTGILPISSSQDTAGPMARTVADAAALLAVLAGPDPADPASRPASFEVALDRDALQGARLAVVAPAADDDPPRRACVEQALAALAGAGAELVPVTLPELGEQDQLAVLHHEFARDVDAYLARLPATAPVRTLAQLREWNLAHADLALKYGQRHVDAAVAVDHAAADAAYRQTRARDLAFTSGALATALGTGLDAVVFAGADGCGWAARAGWPSVVVPAGYRSDNRRPVGLMFVGRPWADGRLLALAYAFEQVGLRRRPPETVNPALFRRR